MAARSVFRGVHLSITVGTLDRPTGLKGEYHIFCDSKSDYYDITDGLPRYPGPGCALA